MNIFIDYSEFHRMHTSDVKYVKNVYPLVEQKITREKCIELIKSKGYLIPQKSGCYFCMFTPKKKWIELKNNHPDLFQKTLDLEKNAMYTKEGKRKWNLKPLINMRGKESKTLFECACFNG